MAFASNVNLCQLGGCEERERVGVGVGCCEQPGTRLQHGETAGPEHFAYGYADLADFPDVRHRFAVRGQVEEDLAGDVLPFCGRSDCLQKGKQLLAPVHLGKVQRGWLRFAYALRRSMRRLNVYEAASAKQNPRISQIRQLSDEPDTFCSLHRNGFLNVFHY